MDLDCRLSFLRLVAAPDQESPRVKNVACMCQDVEVAGPLTRWLCGGPDGTFMHCVFNSSEMRVTSVKQYSLVMSAGGASGRTVSSPINQVEYFCDGSGRFAFSLWESDLVFISTLCLNGDDSSAVVSLGKMGKRVDSGSLGCFSLHPSNEKLLCWGTERGSVLVGELGCDPYFLGTSKGGIQENCILFDKNDAHGENVGIECVTFIESKTSNDVLFASGGCDGCVIVWSLKADGSSGMLTVFEAGLSREICSLKVHQMIGGQSILGAGFQDGSALLWNLNPFIVPGGDGVVQLACFGSILESGPVHCIAFRDARDGGVDVVLGDDAGQVWVYSSSGNVLSSQSWSLQERIKVGSPVVHVSILSENKLLAGSCEDGIHGLSVGDVSSDDASTSSGDDSLSEESEYEEEYTVPEPVPLPSRQEYSGGIPSRGTVGGDEAPRPQEYPVYPSDFEEEDEGIAEEETQERVCYDGFLDENLPPLPLSQYHEPSLHSSEKVKTMLEQLRLKSFESERLEREKQVEQEIQVKCSSAVATACLDIPKTESVYSQLVPIRYDSVADSGQAIRVPRARPQISQQFRRKTISQRQAEVIEKHRLEKLERVTNEYIRREEEVKKKHASIRREEETKSKQPNPLSATSPDQKHVLEQSTQGGAAVEVEQTPARFPWAKQEFYLSKFEDGKIGFHNFRSLQS
mmetsp:Transcript_12785/g.20283  ORF Transcript_12785/g.20283 Transcript_12785/m.20283 type:complete len:689 (+) Transcript_12785:139-2205(+)